jgi:uncharacterized protein
MIPRELDLCVTNNCNMNCLYCYAAGKNLAKKSLTLEEMKKAILVYFEATLSEKRKIDKISISGGEPLTHWKVVDPFISWFAQHAPKDVNAEIFTNGLLLDKAKAKHILDNGFKLRISIDGAKKTHDGSRISASGKSSFDGFMKNFNSFPVSLKKRCEAVPIISEKNVSDMVGNMKFLMDLGFDCVKPSFVLNEVWQEKSFKILERQLALLKSLLKKKKYSLRFEKIALKNLSGGPEEFSASNEISIGTDGYFYPSSLISASVAAKGEAFKRKYRLGNINSGIDVKKFGKLRQEAFKDIKKSKAKLYLGCLLCMHYSSKVKKSDFKKLLLSGERIAEITVQAGLGEVSA